MKTLKDFEMSGSENRDLPRTAMRKIVIAVDIDGTLRCNCSETCRDTNDDVVELCHLLKKMKNTKLVAWSGGGSSYAQSFVDSDQRLQAIFGQKCYGKIGAPFKPDIAIDDIQDTALGVINLIVREE